MLNWALACLIVALSAAIVAFGGVAGTALLVAKSVFFVSIALFLLSTVAQLVRMRS